MMCSNCAPQCAKRNGRLMNAWPEFLQDVGRADYEQRFDSPNESLTFPKLAVSSISCSRFQREPRWTRTRLRAQLAGNYPRRVFVVEVVTARSSGRQVGEIVVIDRAEELAPPICGRLSKILPAIGQAKLVGCPAEICLAAVCRM